MNKIAKYSLITIGTISITTNILSIAVNISQILTKASANPPMAFGRMTMLIATTIGFLQFIRVRLTSAARLQIVIFLISGGIVSPLAMVALGVFVSTYPPTWISIPLGMVFSIVAIGSSWALSKFVEKDWTDLHRQQTECSPIPRLCRQCQNCAHSPHLLCATNPDGPGLDGCRDFLSQV